MEGSVRQVRVTTHPIYSSLLTYPRLGQEPPPEPTEDVFDGRSLAEVCLLVVHCPTPPLTHPAEISCQQSKDPVSDGLLVTLMQARQPNKKNGRSAIS